MIVEYSALLNDNNGEKYRYNGHVDIDSEKGYFGDKDFNNKVTEAIYKKHPDCTILEFGPNSTRK